MGTRRPPGEGATLRGPVPWGRTHNFHFSSPDVGRAQGLFPGEGAAGTETLPPAPHRALLLPGTSALETRDGEWGPGDLRECVWRGARHLPRGEKALGGGGERPAWGGPRGGRAGGGGGAGGAERGRSPNEQISQTARSENKTQTCTLPNSRAVWKRGGGTNKKIHILIQKSSTMCCGTKVFFTAFFICDLTQPPTGTPSAARVWW